MPTVQHSALTGAELHEPKGISGAAANDTYVADGSGGGAWGEPEPKDVSTATAGEVYRADGAASGAWEDMIDYANVYTQESDAVTVSSIGTTAQTLPFSNNGPDLGAVADQVNNRITLTRAGDYEITFTLSAQTAAVADAGEYEFTIELDGGNTVYNAKHDFSGTDDLANIVVQGLLTVTAGQQLTVEVVSDEAGDTDDLTIICASLTAKRIS